MTTIPQSIIDIAAALPTGQLRPPVMLVADRRVSRKSQGKTDAQPAGVVASVSASRDGTLPAAWGITTAGKKERDGGPDGDWVIRYTLRAPGTDAERAQVVAAISARWLAEAERIAGLGHSDGSDDRLLAAHDQRVAVLRSLIAAARADMV